MPTGMNAMNAGMLGQRTQGGLTSGLSAPPAFITELGFARPPAPVLANRVQAEVQNVISRSFVFNNNRDIRLSTEGSVHVLEGTVGSDRERLVAEAILRLTPGVREVKNSLQVIETTPPPKPGSRLWLLAM